MPAVISPLETRDALLVAGAAVVTYRVHWELLRPLAQSRPPPPPTTVGKWLLASPTPQVIGKAYFGFQAHGATDAVPRVLDTLATIPEIDPRRIGIGGLSTTGFGALMAVAADRRIAAAAVVVACGDFHDFLHRSPLAMNGAPLDLDPEYDAWLREREPYRHPERVVHAAVLMVNGTDDATVPLSCAETTARAFRRAYEQAGTPERFRFVPVEGGTHVLGARAMEEVMAWWQRWLLAPSPDGAPHAEGAHRLRDERPVGREHLALGDRDRVAQAHAAGVAAQRAVAREGHVGDRQAVRRDAVVGREPARDRHRKAGVEEGRDEAAVHLAEGAHERIGDVHAERRAIVVDRLDREPEQRPEIGDGGHRRSCRANRPV
jgi:hypothetical protein